MSWEKRQLWGQTIYASKISERIDIIKCSDGCYKIRIEDEGYMCSPQWDDLEINQFNSLEDAKAFLSSKDLKRCTLNEDPNLEDDILFAVEILGLENKDDEPSVFSSTWWYGNNVKNNRYRISAKIVNSSRIDVKFGKNSTHEVKIFEGKDFIPNFIKCCESFMNKHHRILADRLVILENDTILAGVSARDISAKMVRCKSSNVWSYCLDVRNQKDKFGTLYIQFKGDKGGAGDVYQYFDVPVKLYRRLITAPSKGHFVWQYIRNVYQYRKLTGDKKGKLKNAIN